MATLHQYPFPVHYKHKSYQIHGILTDILSLSFTDRILIILTQVGRFGSLIQASLDHPIVSSSDLEKLDLKGNQVEDVHVNKFKFERHTVNSNYLLGNLQGSPAGSVYQIIASQIMNQIVEDNCFEKRQLIIAVALKKDLLDEATSPSSEGRLSETLQCLAKLTSTCRVW